MKIFEIEKNRNFLISTKIFFDFGCSNFFRFLEKLVIFFQNLFFFQEGHAEHKIGTVCEPSGAVAKKNDKSLLFKSTSANPAKTYRSTLVTGSTCAWSAKQT